MKIMKNIKTTLLYIFFGILFSNSLSGQVCLGDSAKVVWKYYDLDYDYDFEELEIEAKYPNTPDLTKNLYKLNLPYNYDNYFGAVVEGFIRVDSNTDVQFNVTGDKYVQFYLSSDMDPANATIIANVPNSTGTEEHDKYPEDQTSQVITLVAGQYYYFKLRMTESTGSDHARVWWKTDLVDPDEWNVITAQYIWGADCDPDMCPAEGTPCDDGDASTIDDKEDGYCNCVGTPPTMNACVGLQGELFAYRFDSIEGTSIENLFASPNFPSMPADGKKLNDVLVPKVNEYDQIGTQVQGFLTVPVTGNYKFNITGDDNTIFYLSSDDQEANKQDHFCIVYGYTDFNQFDKYITQETGNIYLEKGEYYFFEIDGNEGGGSEFFALQWQTPFTEEGVWKRIPMTLTYDYTCELACIDQGTPCDDGNIFTNNDMFDENCNCVGTPCVGDDCDSPLANYVPKDPCDETELLDNNPGNNWLSCSKDENPNPARDSSHWIMYDLGSRYELHGSHVWNYNVENETNNGFETVAIDISEDGVNWTEWGIQNWPLAAGEDQYYGFSGPNFMGEYARFVLFTSLDMDQECKGIGKVNFEAVFCPMIGTACDDGDSETIYDYYDDNCECKGVSLYTNLCEQVSLMLGDSSIATNVYSAEEYVSSMSQVMDTSTVSLLAGNYVELLPGFETETNSLFIAAVEACTALSMKTEAANDKALAREKAKEEKARMEIEVLEVIPIENTLDYMIKYYVSEPGPVKLHLVDSSGKLISILADARFRNGGMYKKRIRTVKLPKGKYSIKLVADDEVTVKGLDK